ncbi:hypothetical protein NMY22_g15232 [Coprinellus aureogranulatus]|nr:hypothetical protein NMY22_g15232 [Coprinellus aureogranulatus]
MDEPTPEHGGRTPGSTFTIFPNAREQTIGCLDVQAAGRDIIQGSTIVNMVANIAVQYSPSAAQQATNLSGTVREPGTQHSTGTGGQQSAGFSVMDVCQIFSRVVTCWAEDGDSDDSVSVKSLNAGLELPAGMAPTYAEIYVRGLLHSGYGLACWEPAPHGNDAEGSSGGVMPGDVGTYSVDRSFTKLFNIWEDEAELRNGETIVDGVSQNSPANETSPDQVVIVHEFHYQSHPGAVLALTSSADLVSSNDIHSLRTFIVEHAEAIYRHANSIRQIGDRESLYIISGCIKTDGWAIAAYRHEMQPPHNVLQLVRKPALHVEGVGRNSESAYQWTKQGHSTRPRQ